MDILGAMEVTVDTQAVMEDTAAVMEEVMADMVDTQAAMVDMVDMVADFREASLEDLDFSVEATICICD